MEIEDEIFTLREKFKPDTPDITWLDQLGKEGNWIIVSGDLRISKRPQERDVWKASRLPTIFMTDQWSMAQKWEQASLLFRWWPDLKKTAKHLKPGEAIQILFQGNFKARPFT